MRTSDTRAVRSADDCDRRSFEHPVLRVMCGEDNAVRDAPIIVDHRAASDERQLVCECAFVDLRCQLGRPRHPVFSIIEDEHFVGPGISVGSDGVFAVVFSQKHPSLSRLPPHSMRPTIAAGLPLSDSRPARASQTVTGFAFLTDLAGTTGPSVMSPSPSTIEPRSTSWCVCSVVICSLRDNNPGASKRNRYDPAGRDGKTKVP